MIRPCIAGLLAYVSDFYLLETATLPHGISHLSGKAQVASIDHAMWFHRSLRVDDWLLYAVESPSASGARLRPRQRVRARWHPGREHRAGGPGAPAGCEPVRRRGLAAGGLWLCAGAALAAAAATGATAETAPEITDLMRLWSGVSRQRRAGDSRRSLAAGGGCGCFPSAHRGGAGRAAVARTHRTLRGGDAARCAGGAAPPGAAAVVDRFAAAPAAHPHSTVHLQRTRPNGGRCSPIRKRRRRCGTPTSKPSLAATCYCGGTAISFTARPWAAVACRHRAIRSATWTTACRSARASTGSARANSAFRMMPWCTRAPATIGRRCIWRVCSVAGSVGRLPDSRPTCRQVLSVEVADHGGHADFSLPDGRPFRVILHSDDWPFDASNQALILILQDLSPGGATVRSWTPSEDDRQVRASMKVMDARLRACRGASDSMTCSKGGVEALTVIEHREAISAHQSDQPQLRQRLAQLRLIRSASQIRIDRDHRDCQCG